MLLEHSPVPSANCALNIADKAATRRVNRPNQLKLYRLIIKPKNKQQINILSAQKTKKKVFMVRRSASGTPYRQKSEALPRCYLRK